MINSNRLDYRHRIDEADEKDENPKIEMPQLTRYEEDEEIKTLKRTIESGKASKAFLEKYMVQNGLLYYLSNRDEDVRPRLYIPKQIRGDLLRQLHDDMWHIGIDKTYELIGRKYFWPGLYKDVTKHVNSCVVCQSRSGKCEIAPLEKTDVPFYPFEKISLDVSGPYGESSQGNKYIVSFVDWLTN